MDKTGISLGIASDELIYIFINGQPIGTGIPQGASGDVFGYIDENNTIVLKGNLLDGAYNVKYEMEDGSTVDIGDLVLDTNIYYSVSSNLTNCTNSNNALTVVEGESYSATISAIEGYELSSVTVTMGGSPVTVTNGVINITSVTGNIVITAMAEEVVIPESRLPSEYQEVEWVQIVKGENWGYHDGVHTNIQWKNANKIIAKIQNVTSGNTNDLIFSSWASQTSKQAPYIGSQASKSNYMYAASSGLDTFSLTPSNLSVTNTEVNDFVFTFTAISTNDIFFGGWQDGTFSHPHKWYSVEIYNGNTLLAYFVPCYRKADNVNGFYDLVGGVFYTNAAEAAEGHFTSRGNEVTNEPSAPSEPEVTNYFNKDTALLNHRLGSGGSPSSFDGMVTTDFIPIDSSMSDKYLKISGITLVRSSSYGYVLRIVYYDENKTKISEDNSLAVEGESIAPHRYYIPCMLDSMTNFTDGYLRAAIVIKDNVALTSDDIANLKLTLTDELV